MDYLLDVFQLTPAAKPAVVPVAPANRSQKMGPKRFGNFELTDAVRPSSNARIHPCSGYRYDKYVDEEAKTEIPVIMAAASREFLFPIFLQLIQQLGPVVDVVLETSHEHDLAGHRDLFREQIDMPVLISILEEYENILTNDGCTGIAVLNPKTPQEVQFDEHKMLIMYGHPLENFERVLEEHNIRCVPQMHFITETEHIHASNRNFKDQFHVLSNLLGTDDERRDELSS